MALTDPAPSQAIDVFKRNMEDSDRFVNQTSGTVTNRTGKTMRPLPVISDAIEQQITSLTADINAAKADLYPIVKFRFLVDTYEITNRNELGDTATGETYRYIGATLPFNVTPATNPVGNPDFVQVIQTDHNNLTNRNAAGAHNASAIDYSESGGNSVESALRGRAAYMALAEAQASTLDVGQYVRLTDKNFGLFKVTNDTPNGYGIIDIGGGNSLTIVAKSFHDVKALGADDSGSVSSSNAFATICAAGKTPDIGDGTYKLTETLVLSKPAPFIGNGANTKFVFDSVLTSPCFSIAPTAGQDPKNWRVGNFAVDAPATATNIINLDISQVGEYLSKLIVESIVSNNQTSGYFMELLNTNPNIDGLFTSVVQDNWSYGGYYLNNIGDSVYFLRNTTTGNGYGYYVSQLPTAANVAIKDGNCTVNGNALYIDKGQNITFDNMQVECPSAFTGLGDALIYINHTSGGLVSNVEVTDCNLNTQGNPKYCISLLNTDLVQISGNDMYADINNGGAHIVIGATARNTVIGQNKYYDSTNGNETSPVIIDNGVGTEGVWKNTEPTLSDWSSVDTVNFHPVGVFKSDGVVSMRGAASGTAIASPGETLFTLPEGFRPKFKAYLQGAFGVPTSAVLQILPTGEVQCLTTGITTIYFNSFEWSTR